ncbi:hypothetical protein DB345_17340 [Spartobacteria bacterium LR76]|nr:hypothetical protein DB345_17340 [Spartobacteria bacterium LR76]
MNESNAPINPLNIAYRLNLVRNFEDKIAMNGIEAQPGIPEMIWALQWFSEPKNFPGGLDRFAAEFIEQNQERLGPPALRECLAAGGIDAILEERLKEVVPNSWIKYRCRWKFLSDLAFAEVPTPGELHKDLVDDAKEVLSAYLRRACHQPGVEFFPCSPLNIQRFYDEEAFGSSERPLGGFIPWYWPNIWNDLISWMDRRAELISSEIAKTRVSEDVRKWVRLSRETRLPVWLNGSSRFGKTETLKSISKARPGAFRLVDTPDDSSVLSLCRAIAKALGIDCANQTEQELRINIEDVLEFSGIMLLFDEAHFIFGSTSGGNIRPKRLDMVRRLIIDKGYPVCFVSTPQSYGQARRKFEKATSFTFEQLDGRLLSQNPINLPEEISHEEVVAVAAIHMPTLSADYHDFVARHAQAVKGSIYSYVRSVAKLAEVYSQDAGRSQISLADIESAVSDVLPALPPSAPAVPVAPAPTRKKATAETIFHSNDRRSEEIPPESRIQRLPVLSDQKETPERSSLASAAA